MDAVRAAADNRSLQKLDLCKKQAEPRKRRIQPRFAVLELGQESGTAVELRPHAGLALPGSLAGSWKRQMAHSDLRRNLEWVLA